MVHLLHVVDLKEKKDTDKERAKKAYYEIQGKSVTPEQAVEMMEKINKAEAQANGTFMKAPNGKATNLNEAQWVDVRTRLS